MAYSSCEVSPIYDFTVLSDSRNISQFIQNFIQIKIRIISLGASTQEMDLDLAVPVQDQYH